MNYKSILKFIEQNPVCTIATAINNQPHVRAFLTNIIDETLYFTTSADKKVGQEILNNRESELCYLASDYSKMLRIRTTIKIIEDTKMKQHLIDTREYLKHFSVEDPSYILFTLSNSEATFWTLEDNLKEEKLQKIRF